MPWMIYHGITQWSIFSSYQLFLWSLQKCLLPIFIAAIVRETYSFIKIKQSISPYYNWENGAKQIRLLKNICHKSCILLKKICHKSCILCQLLREKTLASRSKCIKHFFLPLFALYLLSGWDLFSTSFLS